VSLDFAFIYRDRFYHFINGTDFQAPVESPGIVLHTCMIEDSIAAGVREYDFMWGEESYKYDWGAQRRADQTLIYHATLRAKLLRTIKAGKAWLKSKQPDV
jgi:CelD/BcsL family acetyltransferase involved in cellulose biosynthesis